MTQQPAPTPVSITLAPAERTLVIDWSDGRTSRLSHAQLRERCRCAACVQLGRDGSPLRAAKGICLVGIEPYGPNAVTLRFDDGHDRGIYPFAYLLEIRETAADAR